MPPKPNNRNKWNDVQTTIATIAIAATLGMWNLFATPAKTVAAQTEEPTLPPTEPPVPVTAEPTSLPQVKIMFTQVAQQTTVVQQPQQATKKKKRKNKDNNNGGGGGGGGGAATVTQTQSS